MIVDVHPYLVTNGNGQEAVKFYTDALNAEVISLQTFGDMPDNPEHKLPNEAKNRVMNAQFKVGNTTFMLSDTFPGQPYHQGSQVTIALSIRNSESARTIFEKLSQDGKIRMPLQETFWSPLYGQVTDKYGVEWQISTLNEN